MSSLKVPRFPVLIPSKGRHHRTGNMTWSVLDKMGVPYRVVVEDQERDAYAERVGEDRVLVLPQRYKDEYDAGMELAPGQSTGSGPARNFIWDLATEEGHARHWIMDDNIVGFARLNKNRRTYCLDGMPFHAMESHALQYTNVAEFGPQYWMFATPREKRPPFVTGTRLFSCICLRNDISDRWRLRYNEDLDLSLRLLKAGWATIQYNAFLQIKTQTQVMGGGNTEAFYGEEGTLPKSQMIVRAHPDVVKLNWRYGRWHHSVNYNRFKNVQLIRDPDAEPIPDYREKEVKTGKKRKQLEKNKRPDKQRKRKPKWDDPVLHEMLDRLGEFEPKAPVRITSRGRHDRVLVAPLLEGHPDWAVVVDPKEGDDYAKHLGADHVIVKDKDDLGLAYARNWILDRTDGWVWLVDDDIHQAFDRRDKKRTAMPSLMPMLGYIEAVADLYSNVASLCPTQDAYAFGLMNGPLWELNKFICAMALQRDVGIRYRTYEPTNHNWSQDDRDYMRQVYEAGYVGMICRRLTINMKPIGGGGAGGMTDVYADNEVAAAHIQQYLDLWPDESMMLRGPNKVPRVAPSRCWSKYEQEPQPV